MSHLERNFIDFIKTVNDKRIVLLRETEVVQWLCGDLSFLKPPDSDSSTYKILEDRWGQRMLKTRRPDLKLDKQWTNKFGEHICEELYALSGKDLLKPAKQLNYMPDGETDDLIVETKTGTFYTTGTAGEKILGCPFKYAEIPHLYGKPLKIVCIGGAEKMCRENYGNLPGKKCSSQKQKFLDFFRKNRIEYIGASDILRSLSVRRSRRLML
jgi:hypothetical protein